MSYQLNRSFSAEIPHFWPIFPFNLCLPKVYPHISRQSLPPLGVFSPIPSFYSVLFLSVSDLCCSDMMQFHCAPQNKCIISQYNTKAMEVIMSVLTSTYVPIFICIYGRVQIHFGLATLPVMYPLCV